MRLGEILNAGEIELVQQAHLVQIDEVGSTEKGKPFLKGRGLSPTPEGEFTTKLVLNVFPNMAMTTRLSEIVKAPGLVLIFGELSIGDSDYGTTLRSLNGASVALFDDQGEFSLDGGTLKGTPGTVVYIPVSSKATLKTLETVTDRPPQRKTVELKKKHEMRGKGMGPKPDSSTQDPGSPDSATAPNPAGAVN